jgi:hypothetical protein
MHLASAQRSKAASPNVELTVPADPSVLGIARLVASGVASMAGFDIGEIEDVRIGVDELCTAMISVAPEERVNILFSIEDRSIAVEATVAAPNGIREVVLTNPLTDAILAVVTDEHGWDWSAGRLTGRLRKRAQGRRLTPVS